MNEWKNKEFFTDPMTGEGMFRDVISGDIRKITESDHEAISYILEESESFYPEQYSALSEAYKKSSLNRTYYDFIRARRIINCCYGDNDRQPDYDQYGNRHFELIKCPLMAECKYFKVICQPTFKSELSQQELRIMRLFFKGHNSKDIAEALYISEFTVENHRKHSFRKLKVHSMAEFFDYAHKVKLFND